ncbi:hypothetical protein [Flavobacterium aciduliphilum]|uniref:Uncharacterized protein n=1 Tax=Flavobacterium aciduliphilum TaxID=1101402 RepID=A0A328Y6K7_9FLAO|nr:hypothetical protein [Flavobacterium aciduliphilum]RAR69302.1 hypothetical protein CLV55_11623 [Flavobacterium aciduliphilum]
MKKLLFSFSYFTAILGLIILVVFYLGYSSLNNSRYFKISTDSKILVLGHSHPECAFNNRIILNLTNLGKSGETYFYTYLKLKKILPQNKQIKFVLLEFENSEVDTVMNSWTWDDSHIYHMFPRYFPLMDKSDLKFILSKNSKAIFNCLPRNFINEFGFNIYSNYLKKKGIISNKRFGGYNGLKRNKVDTITNNSSKYKSLNNNAIPFCNVFYLQKIVNFCNSNKVKIFFIRSPFHRNYKYAVNESKYNMVKKKYFSRVELLDFKDFHLSSTDYGDLGHLNYSGSNKFSIFFNKLLNLGLLDKVDKATFIKNEIHKNYY